MDYIKSSLGYGTQSGQEPISGETGKGTADQPYDSGNVAGQSGAPAPEATSTNPTGTTQYDTGTAEEKPNDNAIDSGTHQFDTGENPNTNATDSNTRESSKLNTTETLAAGVTSSDSSGPTDAPADSRPLDSTSGGASKGTDEGPGPDEQVTSNQSGPGSNSQTNAQDTFFQKAHLDKDKPAGSPKIPDEIQNKEPLTSPSGADTSSETVTSTAANPDPAPPTSSATDKSSSAPIGSSPAEKGYKTADTEPHPQSSEVLSSATPGAALDSPHQQQSSPQAPTQPSNDFSSPQPSASTGAADTGNTTVPTTLAAADTDYPSPKSQPSEAQGGLSGVSHNTGGAPKAPDTGSEAAEDPSLGASQGQGKKKMGDRIKEKLHIGKKSSE